MGFVSHGPERAINIGAIWIEDSVQEPANVLEHHRSRVALLHQSERFGKKVSLVLGSKLLSGFRKWWTRDSTRKQVDSFVSESGERFHAALDHVPGGPIVAKRRARVRVVLYKRDMLEASLLQADSLPTRASTDFNRSQSHWAMLGISVDGSTTSDE